MVVENVRGAIPWVGRSRWNFGSFHLWGDVPALMPFTRAGKLKGGKQPGIGWSGFAQTDGVAWRNRQDALKLPGFRFDGSGRSFQSASVAGVKHHGSGAVWFDTGPASLLSSSPRRKMASAMIARIPLPLARRWLVRVADDTRHNAPRTGIRRVRPGCR